MLYGKLFRNQMNEHKALFAFFFCFVFFLPLTSASKFSVPIFRAVMLCLRFALLSYLGFSFARVSYMPEVGQGDYHSILGVPACLVVLPLLQNRGQDGLNL